MPNSLGNVSDETVKKYTRHMFKKGSISKGLDIANAMSDIKYGKRDLPNDLKYISNNSYAEMIKMQSGIDGFKK